MATLVPEIATASTEQAQGIEQVNSAVVEMDRVVQHNAASAEQSASVAQQMSAQSEEMRAMVDQLMVLWGGKEKDLGAAVREAPVPVQETGLLKRSTTLERAPLKNWLSPSEIQSFLDVLKGCS